MLLLNRKYYYPSHLVVSKHHPWHKLSKQVKENYVLFIRMDDSEIFSWVQSTSYTSHKCMILTNRPHLTEINWNLIIIKSNYVIKWKSPFFLCWVHMFCLAVTFFHSNCWHIFSDKSGMAAFSLQAATEIVTWPKCTQPLLTSLGWFLQKTSIILRGWYVKSPLSPNKKKQKFVFTLAAHLCYLRRFWEFCVSVNASQVINLAIYLAI